LPAKATQIDCVLFSAQRKVSEVANNSNGLYLMTLLFNRAANIFGICEQTQLKWTAFCLAAQRNFLEVTNKTTQIDWENWTVLASERKHGRWLNN
jgi:hypothetical protein